MIATGHWETEAGVRPAGPEETWTVSQGAGFLLLLELTPF